MTLYKYFIIFLLNINFSCFDRYKRTDQLENVTDTGNSEVI